MTLIQIVVAGVTIVFVFCFFGAIAGLFADRTYHPMSPDEEYRWLTEDCGLTHDEALEYQRPTSRWPEG